MSEQIFISYSREDRYCARLLTEKLIAAGFSVWRDAESLIPSRDWRSEIELGIDGSRIVLVLMSRASCGSSYVTFEWAFALGRRKIVVPVKLEECDAHKRLDVLQYAVLEDPTDDNFSLLVGRLKLIIENDEAAPEEASVEASNSNDGALSVEQQILQAAIMAYLYEGGYQAVSFSRIRERIDGQASEAELEELVRKSPYFQKTTLRDKRPGLRYIA